MYRHHCLYANLLKSSSLLSESYTPTSLSIVTTLCIDHNIYRIRRSKSSGHLSKIPENRYGHSFLKRGVIPNNLERFPNWMECQLDSNEIRRYGRQMILPELGMSGNRIL